ncbi:MAG: hypothetical protein N7Q72_02775 [Spiroplasma sp. Tabriz.8]|nr:hypothetical protein [Spiroplasma sp. Tabriz.8]
MTVLCKGYIYIYIYIYYVFVIIIVKNYLLDITGQLTRACKDSKS